MNSGIGEMTNADIAPQRLVTINAPLIEGLAELESSLAMGWQGLDELHGMGGFPGLRA